MLRTFDPAPMAAQAGRAFRISASRIGGRQAFFQICFRAQLTTLCVGNCRFRKRRIFSRNSSRDAVQLDLVPRAASQIDNVASRAS